MAVSPISAPFLVSQSEVLRYEESWRAAIIGKVFDVLTKIIEILQKTAATQSDRLQLYTQWQKAYSSQLDQIPSFTANNSAYSTVVTGSEDKQVGARDDMNKITATFTQQIQGRQNIVSDDAKSLQTNVNQTSDAVNQQTNMATSLLEQLSTILGSIFK